MYVSDAATNAVERAIASHWRAHGTAPTLRHLAEVTNYETTNVYRAVARLVREGQARKDRYGRPVLTSDHARILAALNRHPVNA